MAAKIRRNDDVIVLTGKDKGKKGKVVKVYRSGKVVVEGINFIKKHQKPVPASGQKGGIIKQEAAIDVSNVAIFNTTTGKADRVGFRFEDGKKVRFFKSNGENISSFK
ncbi:50S ribosomal protein L24 [Candidatus Photodesmus blepharus]|uniref:Large ribosomal subunit protein uL24 n=1 Tax=Candidatus Photodesmus blepharonis TaxID=1179155 RepID=A0A084CM65_9GAMM|nr:50S ribosomal protein L24 [Candidatus Photodesmus blepharus]KEY90894.1 50S ribosomal protein L24 [Candidatus Photodesmus blepharus]